VGAVLVKIFDDVGEPTDMVKQIDDRDLESIEHVGIVLWRAATMWRTEFREKMAERGYPWHMTAAGEVLSQLGPSGISQSALTDLMGVSKQAVQQLVDQLEAQGVVRREPDPTDGRARTVMLTELGLKDFAERNRVKRAIEARYRDKLGDMYAPMVLALDRLAE
jgi:DNA-binding MarR family transcriptional regulator